MPITKITSFVVFLVTINSFSLSSFAAESHGGPSNVTTFNWDVDGDGQADALTDGLLILRYSFGLRGNNLTSDAISTDSSLSLTEVESRVANTMTIADIDGNSEIDALSDGLLILRYLFGLRNNSLIAEVVANNATRTSLSDISDYLTSGMPNQTSADYDQDQISDALDPDDDNDGIPDTNDPYPFNALNGIDSDADGLTDMFDDYPNDANNVIDSDGDGVANRFDVFPNDSSKTKAVVVNLRGAQSIGLGEALAKQDNTEQILSSIYIKNNPKIKSFLDIFINKAYASTSTSISNLTNAIAWDEQGQVLDGSILSSETLFIAEAGLTPDGQFLYLLTSNHIQRALDDMDNEVCSIYKIHMQDYTIECLLASDLGDIEPSSLKGTMQTDYSRSGIDFRSDGSAVMTGFDWTQELPTGVSGGTNSTIAWFLTADGQLTSLLHDEGYFAVSALWLNDEHFAVAEYPFLGEDGPINPEHNGRIVIYNASDLSIHKRITAENIWGPTVRADGDIFWQYGGALDGETLETFQSPIDGIPVTDNKSANLYGLIDYMGTENSLLSADLSIEIPVSDGIATGYEWRKGSGTGTDISYRTFAFSDEYIAYIKSFGAAEPIVSIDGHSINQGVDIELSDNRGRLLINHNANDQWFIAPATTHEGNLLIDYQVQTNTGIQDRQIIIDELTINNWRLDTNRPSVNSDARFEDAAIKWASPSPEREGICIYQFNIDDSVCALPQGNVVKTDMESFRSTRYDNDAVYPNGSGNAYPGIRNVFFDNGRIRVFYKDSDNHQYYQAVAEIDEFLANGENAFSYVNAVNGQGEQNIITEAISLKPEPALVMEGINLTLIDSQTLNVNFPEPLSSVAPKPILTVSRNDQLIPQNSNITWNESLTVATIELTEALTDLSEVVVRTQSSIFIRDSIQQYMINNDDFIEGVAPIGNLDSDGDGIINELDNDDDNDGVEDILDLFPYNPYENSDSDGDGVGDNSDLFPFDASESRDSDNDGWGNNSDHFPMDETEWIDSDGDGIGDNSDAYPYDSADNENSNTFVYSCGDYCSESNGLSYYHFALNENIESFPIHLGGESIRLEYAGGLGGGSFIYTDSDNQQIVVELDNIDDSIFLNSLQNNSQSLLLGKNGDNSVDNSFKIYDGETQVGILNLVSNNGYNVNGIKQLYPRIIIDRVSPGTGSRNSAQCSEFTLNSLAEGITHHGQISLVPNDLVKGGAMNLLGIGGENSLYVCEDTPVGNHQIMVQALDGQGGKKTMHLQIDVLNESLEGGAIEWADCGNPYCQFMEGEFYYQFALNPDATTYPYHLFNENYRLDNSGGSANAGFLVYENDQATRIFSSYDEITDIYVPMDSHKITEVIKASEGSITMSRNLDEGIDNSFNIYIEDQRIGKVNLVANQNITVMDIIQNYDTLYVEPVLSGTGSRENNQCSEFGMDDFASGIEHHGQISILPDNLVAGGAMSLLGRGGENSVYVCQDTPSGQYELTLTAMDGIGGKRNLNLTVIVSENPVENGSIRWE